MVFIQKKYIYITLSLVSSTIYSNTDHNKEIAREYAALAREKSRENKLDDAIRLYKKSLDLDPDRAEIHFNLANQFFRQEKFSDAIHHYQRAVSLAPTCAEIYCNLGICANRMDDHKTAITHFRNAINADANCGVAYLQLALTLEKEKEFDEALVYLEKAMHLCPDNHDIPSHIANSLKKLERYDDALVYFYKAHELKPHDINTKLELANILSILDKNEEALALYHTILKEKPTMYNVLYNFGFTLKKLGFIDKSIEIHKKVLEYDPDYALAHFSLAISYLTLGDFEKGWPEYEWRWAAYKEKPREFTQPTWRGEDLKGKRIFVYAEQGYGDTFQFIRYLPLLKKMGAHVIFHSQIALKSLLTGYPYIDEVITYRDPIPAFDYHIPLMSLPLLCNTTLKTIPTDIPYLYARDNLVAEWKEKLANNTFKIGICWQGNSKYPTTSLRRAVAAKSLHVKHFAALADIPGITLYSLQKINGTEQIDELDDASFLQVFGPDLDTTNGRFNDTAAIIKNLDLVITIDTSIGHFAAALGTPTWILLPEPADWRWLLERTDTPWYPNVRLFRQTTKGDWSTVMQQVVQALCEQLQPKDTKKIAVEPSNASSAHVTQRLTTYINNLKETEPTVSTTVAMATAYALQQDILHYLNEQKGK